MVKTVATVAYRGGHFFCNIRGLKIQGHLTKDRQLDYSCLMLQKPQESHHIISFKASCFFHC